MDVEALETRKSRSEDNLSWRSCCLFRQRGIASRLLSFGFNNFSQARRSYYLYVIVFMRMDTAYSDRVYAKRLRVW